MKRIHTRILACWAISVGVFVAQIGEAAQTAANALPISVGQAREGSLDEPNETDWFWFNATAGSVYVIQVRLGTLTDSVLQLVAPDGETVITTNDDFSGMASEIGWRAPALGTYFAAVAAPYSSHVGNYSIELTEAAGDTGEAMNELGGLLGVIPNDPEANLYMAMLRLVDIFERRDSQLNEVVSAFGFQFDVVPTAFFSHFQRRRGR